VGGGEARPLGCVPVFNYRDALLRFGTHVIGLAKSAHPLRDKTRCRPKDCVFRDHENLRFSNDAGPVSRPREGADAHGYTRHGCNRRPLLRWQFRCVRVLPVPRESLSGTSAGGIKFATGRSAGFTPETTAKPRATAPVVLHTDSLCSIENAVRERNSRIGKADALIRGVGEEADSR